MKRIFILLIATTLCAVLVTAQRNIALHPSFFSLKQSRFSLGVSLETAPLGSLLITSSKPANLNFIYDNPRTGKKYIPYVSYGFVFDLYSAKSLIGLLSGVDYSTSKLGLQKPDKITDLMEINRLEIPLYLKFRPGRINSRKHLWLLLGGIYNLPLSCTREQIDAKLGTSAYTILTDENKNQLNSFFSLAGSFGYEFFAKGEKHFRMAIYTKAIYPLGDEFNNTYSEFKPGGNGVLSNYPGFEIRQYRISIGIKFMFQFGEAVGIMADAIKTSH